VPFGLLTSENKFQDTRSSLLSAADSDGNNFFPLEESSYRLVSSRPKIRSRAERLQKIRRRWLESRRRHGDYLATHQLEQQFVDLCEYIDDSLEGILDQSIKKAKNFAPQGIDVVGLGFRSEVEARDL